MQQCMTISFAVIHIVKSPQVVSNYVDYGKSRNLLKHCLLSFMQIIVLDVFLVICCYPVRAHAQQG